MVRYFSVDEEFSGLDHRKNDLLSIGIIEVKSNGASYRLDHSREFYLELKPYGEANADSMKINGLNLNNLKEYGSTKENAVHEIKKYLDLKPGDKAVFIGYCAVLDKIFMDQLFQDVNTESPFDYEVIEISSLAIGRLGFNWGFTEKELLKRLGLEETENKHNALADAILQAKEFCCIMQKRL